MAGRNPKPGGEKARSGKAQIHFDALNPVAGTPTPPAHLDADAVFAWVEACRSLIPARLVSHIDLLALEMMASAFGRWRKCERACRRSGGEYAKTPNGHKQLSAERINANNALRQVKDLGAKFGMTPVERIKTTESAQGDLPLGDSSPKPEPDAEKDQDDNVVAMHSVFKPRPTTGQGGGQA